MELSATDGKAAATGLASFFGVRHGSGESNRNDLERCHGAKKETMAKSKILISIDVECSMGGYFEDQAKRPVPPDRCIFCKVEGKNDHGIGMIMDILEKNSLRGTFFIETEARHYFRNGEIESVIRYVLGRGHDVQLHVHPNFRFFKNNGSSRPYPLKKYSLENQVEIIREGKEFLRSAGAKSVEAFRAGGGLVNLDTLQALQQNGIFISSNYSLSEKYAGMYSCEYVDSRDVKNDCFLKNGIFEIPITAIIEIKLKGTGFKPLQVCAISSQEMKSAITYYVKAGMNIINIITHSFEYVKKRDAQYSTLLPNRIHIIRLESLCKFLNEMRGDVEIITYSDISNAVGIGKSEVISPRDIFYKSPISDVLMRYLVNYFLNS